MVILFIFLSLLVIGIIAAIITAITFVSKSKKEANNKNTNLNKINKEQSHINQNNFFNSSSFFPKEKTVYKPNQNPYSNPSYFPQEDPLYIPKWKMFENEIKFKLSELAIRKKYWIIDGGLFKHDENKYFEIDAILITKKAIYIVEVKHFSGSLIGSYEDKTLLLVDGNNKIEVTNPFDQNDRHIWHLKKILKEKVTICSFIILENLISLEIQGQNKNPTLVASLTNVEDYLDIFESYLVEDLNLSNDKLESIIKKITDASANSAIDEFKFQQIISNQDDDDNNKTKNKDDDEELIF
ncbi:Hypothetical protein MAU_1500 [Metamycoplasma auris 15026]|uniref:NERD domain-containing protein n=1 Tax=Metamycoplasma auris 15026 TaxID=1188233 RepID=N9V138_9BACT|nr:nuclease-related domain-containing protein [Metamycoplasma auris]ENY69112.1 Hypothetical protein MAU_1500 [Metamycoplasma auris 15026]